MSFDTIINNGLVVTATDSYVADIGIANGTITAIGQDLPRQNTGKVLNANGNVPLGTMTNLGAGNYSFQTTIASIASVNLKSNLGGSTGQGVTIVP